MLTLFTNANSQGVGLLFASTLCFAQPSPFFANNRQLNSVCLSVFRYSEVIAITVLSY